MSKPSTKQRCETVTFTEVITLRNGSKVKARHTLWHADPDCAHKLDPNCWSGIRCLKCPGWYCL